MAFTGLRALAVFAALAVVNASPVVDTRAVCADGTRVTHAQCCSFIPVRDALLDEIFENSCGENAHSTVRIAFHDAIGFSTRGGKGGGADGSMIAFADTELAFPANAGIDEIVDDLKPFADAHGVSYGDIIQFGSSVALSLCPGAPLVQTFVGRKNATAAAPDGTVPDPFNPVGQILSRMADAGFSADEVIALLASHSIAAQDEIEPDIARSPFDSTPDQFDSQVFLEVLLKGNVLPSNLGPGQGEVLSPMEGEFRLQSDEAFARDPRTACTWQSFVANQALMASRFSAAMAKLGLLGHDPRTLVDCTEIIPRAAPVARRAAIIPAGKTRRDIEASCARSAFPNLQTAGGPATTVAPVPEQ
ncbi:manganese peroxidase 1 [Exidia glandulosa HHB12029]|uniref:Peroxidase n=1 Tax=Exidia glandulosa HHB12029 TaxID=1314781 RepID=A0A165EW49_EXIGL|nr:manganese peroxidase 1 [Exidia glandulosa HHB12029]